MQATSYTPAGWIVEALVALRPPKKMRVSEWADEYRILGGGRRPGRWKTSFTPYLRDIMDAFSDPEVEEISMIKSTQVGGTEALLNMMGAAIDMDPDPMMVVYPSDSIVEKQSDNCIQPMLLSTPVLRAKFDSSSKRTELNMGDMMIFLASAQSPSELASTPVRYLLNDEVDKFPRNAGKEASPRALARERTRTYAGKRKIVNVSTPTFEDGPIWKDWLQADTQYEYYVTCPHCSEQWTFVLANLKFDKSSENAARASAVYVCQECGGIIGDKHRHDMIQHGGWKATRSNGKRRTAFRLNAFVSPWISLGDIAGEFIRSKSDPDELMNFINSWLAEPFRDVETTINAQWLAENREGPYESGVVPPETVMITGGVDVQRGHFYWSVRGWRNNMTSFNIAHGKVFSWQEVWGVMNTDYLDDEGGQHIVNLCCIDAGDQTDDVYNFCAVNAEWAVAVMGASRRLVGKFTRSTIDRQGSKANGLPLYTVDTHYYKDMIYARMRRGDEDGGWYIHKDCDGEYCEMVTAEHKVRKKFRGLLSSVWVLKVSGRDNHYLDTEVYAALGADIMGLRTLYAQGAATEQPITSQASPIASQMGANMPANRGSHSGKGWFRK